MILWICFFFNKWRSCFSEKLKSYDHDKLAINSYLRIRRLVGSSVLSEKCRAMLHDTLQHLLYSAQLKHFRWHMNSCFFKNEAFVLWEQWSHMIPKNFHFKRITNCKYYRFGKSTQRSQKICYRTSEAFASITQQLFSVLIEVSLKLVLKKIIPE